MQFGDGGSFTTTAAAPVFVSRLRRWSVPLYGVEWFELVRGVKGRGELSAVCGLRCGGCAGGHVRVLRRARATVRCTGTGNDPREPGERSMCSEKAAGGVVVFPRRIVTIVALVLQETRE